MSGLDVTLLAALVLVGGWRLFASGRAVRARRIACAAVAVLAALQLVVDGFTWQFVSGYVLLAAAASGPWRGGRVMRGLTAALVAVLLAAAILPFALLPAPVLPKPTGPYALGTKVYRLVDVARDEPD